ncbi:hypothetical protein OGAPHI_003893 [Ogataea philodendri]|uniref:Protein LOT5 n=1 Tax=Ogataea philodendri TaxID=1378263 RepID=A0A9P8T544_9ASCO|nr:uncharacterized protein OGAPHI_003893 [Ogataea philodendri]KAH3665705.1 hypothetical protein OGAPHI_003893 [Ogataea philodendri]
MEDDCVLFYGSETWKLRLNGTLTPSNQIQLPFPHINPIDRHSLTSTNGLSIDLETWVFVLNEYLLFHVPAADLSFEIPYEAVALVGLRGPHIYLNVIEGSDLQQPAIECELWPVQGPCNNPLFQSFADLSPHQHLQSAIKEINNRIAATSNYHESESEEELTESPRDVEVHLNEQGEADDELNDQLLQLDEANSSMYVDLGILNGKRTREDDSVLSGGRPKLR